VTLVSAVVRGRQIPARTRTGRQPSRRIGA
jgi:hypothetical protein